MKKITRLLSLPLLALSPLTTVYGNTELQNNQAAPAPLPLETETAPTLNTAPYQNQTPLAPVTSNAENNTVTPDDEPEQLQVEAPPSLTARDALASVTEKARRFTQEKKQLYQRKGRHNKVFITYGTARVRVKASHSYWGDARVMAYQQAQTIAREKLLKTLYSEVSSETVRESFQTNLLPEFSPEELQAENTNDSLLTKMTALSHATVNEKLLAYGIDPREYDAAPPTKRKQMMKKSIANTVTRQSRGELKGALITKTFEETDSAGNTAIALVLTTSNKMKNTLASLQDS